MLHQQLGYIYKTYDYYIKIAIIEQMADYEEIETIWLDDEDPAHELLFDAAAELFYAEGIRIGDFQEYCVVAIDEKETVLGAGAHNGTPLRDVRGYPKVEISVVTSPKARGQGIATSLIEEMVEHWSDFVYDSGQAITVVGDAIHPHSQKIMENLGFELIKDIPSPRYQLRTVYHLDLEPESRDNPDVDLRKLEREYAASPSSESLEKLVRALERSGTFRLFEFGEGWQAQTTLPPELYPPSIYSGLGPPERRVISSATQSHDGWWGIGHVTWIGDGEMRDLGDHATGPHPGPLPTREQVAKAHFEVVNKVKEDGVGSISLYHRWSSYRDNPGPDVRMRELEREYANHPSPETLGRLNAMRVRSGVDDELPIPHLQMLFEGICKLLGKEPETSEDAATTRAKGFHNDYFFKIRAYNLYDSEGEYINAHLEIMRYESGSRRAYQASVAEIYPDDRIYIRRESRLKYARGSGVWDSYDIRLHQPWVYHAEDLLEFVAGLL